MDDERTHEQVEENDEQVEDLEVSEEQAEDVKGGMDTQLGRTAPIAGPGGPSRRPR